MKSRDLAALVFGLAGLYSLLLALLGLAQLVPNLPLAVRHAGGQTQVESAVVGAAVSLLLHLCFGGALLTGRRKLAEWLVPDDEAAAAASSAAAAPSSAAAASSAVPPSAAAAAAGKGDRGRQPRAGGPSATALGLATAGVCAVAILLLARIVTAASYATYLLFTRNSEGDLFASTGAGVLVDLLLVVVGGWLLARRSAVAATLLGAGPDAAPAGDLSWQLPALRFLGLATVAWHLPALVSALGVLIKWWLRPIGFDLRSQALDRIPPAATGVAVGLYLLLLFPRGAGAAARRLLPPPDLD
jgi:hypothetical protein